MTDYLLAAVALCLGWRLLRLEDAEGRRARRLWAWAFVMLGFTALAGGTFHGFATDWPPGPAAWLWKTTLCLVGLMDLLMLSGSLVASFAGRWLRFFLAAAAAKFLLYTVWMIGHDDYRYVVCDYAASMIVILVVHALPGSLRGEPGARWILAGILASFAAAGVQVFRFSLAPVANHNDLYHLVQTCGAYLLYVGICDLRDHRVPGNV